MIYPVLLLASFLLVSSPASARVVDRTMALVNSDVLLRSDLTDFSRLSKLRGELDPFITFFHPKLDTEKDVVEYLIQERLILQKQNPTEDDVEDEIRFIQKNNNITRDALVDVLKSQGFSFADYKSLMRVSVAKRRLIDRELRPLSAVSDEQVKNFYYTDPQTLEKRKAQRLVLTFDLDQLLLPNKATADLAYRKLSDGADLDSLASELSARGVERVSVGKISEENMNPLVKGTVSGLRAGEFSRPLESGSGYLILRVNSVGAPEDPEFNRVKEQVRNQLFQRSLKTHMDAWITRERAASFVHITKGA